MCGIVGYTGSKAAASTVLSSLRLLGYRGYDSAGLASVDGGTIHLRKDAGKLAEVDARCHLGELPGNIAIGHVRWATHGGATQRNAHPHLDCSGRVAVVHNGIIENFQELRRELTEAGHTFASETDTEVIPHLVEDGLKAGLPLEEAVRRASLRLCGSYAFVVMSTDHPLKLVGVCRGCPLVVGVDLDGWLLASDALALAEHTNQVIFPKEGEVVVITPAGALFSHGSNGTTEWQEREPIPLPWRAEEAYLGAYSHYMIKEIEEQPQTIRQALCQDYRLVQEMALDILKAKQVVFTACGTSRYASLIGRYLFSKLGNKLCEVVMASEFQYFAEAIDQGTLVIAISQSGETADVLEGVNQAKKRGAKIFSVVNRPGSLLELNSDRVLYLNCGTEICVAATKSFINQLVILYLLSFAMANRLGEARSTLRQLARRMERNIASSNGLRELAEELKGREHFYYIARGINFAIALEGALKLKEVSYIHAEGMPAGELKHGSLALIEEGTPVVVVCPLDYTYSQTLSNAVEARSRGAFIIGVSPVPNEVFHHWVRIPRTEEVFYPLVSMPPLQLLAYYLAVARGTDPDCPRNLAKSVTVR